MVVMVVMAVMAVMDVVGIEEHIDVGNEFVNSRKKLCFSIYIYDE
jgi:hypothetical protein